MTGRWRNRTADVADGQTARLALIARAVGWFLVYGVLMLIGGVVALSQLSGAAKFVVSGYLLCYGLLAVIVGVLGRRYWRRNCRRQRPTPPRRSSPSGDLTDRPPLVPDVGRALAPIRRTLRAVGLAEVLLGIALGAALTGPSRIAALVLLLSSGLPILLSAWLLG